MANIIDKKNIKGVVAPISIDLLDIIKESKRFGSIEVNNFVQREDEEVQFGAAKFINDDYTVIAYQGTNASIVGWIENFMLTSEYPTKTQVLAIDYLKNIVSEEDKKLYVVGHSKGGNLAMVAAMEADKDIFDRIIKIYNFDGPGFRKQELNSEKFERLNKKTVNILPKGSLVGILMNNKNYEYIEAEGIGFKQHFATSWNVFGQFFIKSKLNKRSKQLMESLQKSVDELNPEDVKKILTTVMTFFRSNNINNIEDLKYMSFEDTRNMLKELKDVDPKSKKLFVQVWRILINP